MNRTLRKHTRCCDWCFERIAGSIDRVASMSPALGQVIRRHRLAAGLSQEDLAERADLHRNHVGYVEHGERSPTVDVLIRIGAALGVPAWALLKEAQEGAEPANPE